MAWMATPSSLGKGAVKSLRLPAWVPRAWTDEGKLRHPSFKGIRERADDAGVFELA